ncbi:hypothetical protein DPMN_068953 [Dreissena polymorpha]|uniref:Uncharacterized protein n=1 Tax=Dreissena polymorpha TaxID=45954 RepID=A0A9D4BTZ4_DREPO|nr:hypothetical protein DPMN_068953 [Dreissena polymorpha]
MSFMNRPNNASFFLGQKGAFKKAVRPVTPEMIEEEEPPRTTKEQASCIHNMALAAAFLVPILLIAGALSFGTTYWFNISPFHVGLFVRYNNWTTLSESVDQFYSNDTISEFDQLKKTWTIGRPLLIAGGSMFVVSFIGLALYPCHRTIKLSKITMAFVVAVVLLIALALYIAGMAMFISYAVKGYNGAKIQWSFYMSSIACGCGFLATLLFWLHVIYQYCCDYR